MVLHLIVKKISPYPYIKNRTKPLYMSSFIFYNKRYCIFSTLLTDSSTKKSSSYGCEKTRLRLHEKSSTLDVTKVLVDTATAKRSCKYECFLSDTQLPQMLSMIESNRFHYKSTIMKEYRYELKNDSIS